MAVDDFLRSGVLEACVRKVVEPYLGTDAGLYEKCSAVSKKIYDSVKGTCTLHGVKVYLVTGSWVGLASKDFSDRSGRPHISMHHVHDWLLIADSDVLVRTIKQGREAMPNDKPGPRQERSAYFDATACQFTGQPWSFEECLGPEVEVALVQDSVWVVE